MADHYADGLLLRARMLEVIVARLSAGRVR